MLISILVGASAIALSACEQEAPAGVDDVASDAQEAAQETQSALGAATEELGDADDEG
jgi:hypothetical protein